MPAGSERPRARAYVCGVLGYLALAFALTFPAVLDPAGGVVTQWIRDADHSLWIQWWVDRALADPALSIFHTDLLRFPDEVNLHLADINLAINLPAHLVASALGPIAAYNAMLWLSFVASAWLFWELARRLCGDSLAGWIAGAGYAASSYWISSALNSWSYLVHIWIFPLVFLALRRAALRPRLVNFAIAGLSVGLSFHVTPYYFLFLGVLLAVLAPWYRRELAAVLAAPGGLAGMAAAFATVLAVVLPRALPMYQASLESQAVHSSPGDLVLASRVLEFVIPNFPRPDRLPEGTYLVVFLGYTTLAIVCAGLWLAPRRGVYWKWLGSAGAMYLLALGPTRGLTQSGAIEIPLPEYWLGQLPGFSSMTNHWRWSLPGSFCLSIAAALALGELLRRAGNRRVLLAGLVGVAFVVELFTVFPFPRRKPFWVQPPDPISQTLAELDSVAAIIDFRAHAKRNQMVHGKRIVGGWLPRVPVRSVEATQQLLDRIRRNPEAQADYLAELGIDAVVLDARRAYRIVPAPGRRGFELRPLRAR